MGVGLIEHDDGALRLVGHEPGNIFLRGEGAGGIVGIADVNEAGIGAGRNHRSHIVGIFLGQRDVDGLGADELGGAGAGFVAGVGYNVRLGG